MNALAILLLSASRYVRSGGMPARPIFLLVAALLTAGVAAILVLFPGTSDRSLRRLQTVGSVRIGYAVEPPYAFIGPSGEVTGEAPEIARVIAARLGIARVEWRQMEFVELIDQLETGQIDVIAAGMFVTPDRRRRVIFSQPTFFVRPGLLVSKGNPLRLESYEQAIQRDDLQLAVLAGSQELLLVERLGAPDSRTVVVPDALTGRKAVESGLADALILSEPTVRWMSRTSERTEVVVPSHAPTENEIYGQTAFAFRNNAYSLVKAWNAELQSYLGSAEHQELLARLGLAGAHLPVNGTPGGLRP